MRLVSVSIENYRSILKATGLTMGDFTVLVGPNNEGKSNILKAINLGLHVLVNWRRGRVGGPGSRRAIAYDFYGNRLDYRWLRDFPIVHQETKPNGRTVIALELELTQEEFDDFYRSTSINLSTNLRIKMGFGSSDVTYDILMKGRGKRTLNSKREEISEFIQQRIVCQYISAIRPASHATSIIDRVLESELSKLGNDPQYDEARQKVKQLEMPILENLADRVYDTMKTFIPTLRRIRITDNDNPRRYFRRGYSLNIDDGTDTDLNLKGDGMVSLSAISLVRHFAGELSDNQNLVFAIEEPESHLHPDGIYQLRSVLSSIAEDSQVIITTHSPILVDRTSIGNNILVRSGQATKAKTIAQIRNALGIRLSDNLVNARLVLLVEGDSDQRVLEHLLSAASPTIRAAIDRGELKVEKTAGAGKLHSYAQFYKQNLSNVYVYFDNDEAGRKEVQAALDNGIILDSEYKLISCQGMKNSELEDMFFKEAYVGKLSTEYSLRISGNDLRGKRKWSDRMEKLFQSQGKLWNTAVEKKVKSIVADGVISTGLDALIPNKKNTFDGLVQAIELKIGKQERSA